jgi:NADH dehydrogenase/NADH:ubiquinone oxidoreductase subunit G
LDPLSGNIIDLCPVGALVSKTNLYSYRFWELLQIESFDILESFCSSIKVEVLNNKIIRILPIVNININ